MTVTEVRDTATIETEVLRVDPSVIEFENASLPHACKMHLLEDRYPEDASNLRRAAEALRNSDVPVAFPTETVYGLGADATRSTAVRGIFKAKNRPSDNPLIVHVYSLKHLEDLLKPLPDADYNCPANASNGESKCENQEENMIPQIYKPLIEKFWPGPLTLIMPNPKKSKLAAEVTAGLETFGARMPSNKLALALIKLAERPLAAPSANASSRPSPTTAQHVKYDLEGRISLIIDGGPCDVGVESTVVDGLCEPPSILRPGGIGLEQIRTCKGWENVAIGYKDASQGDSHKPRAPGMKYRHYSPKAPVILYEWTSSIPTFEQIIELLAGKKSVGVIRTKNWPAALGSNEHCSSISNPTISAAVEAGGINSRSSSQAQRYFLDVKGSPAHEIWEISLGPDPIRVAHGLFSALRELDEKQVGAILIEGINDMQGDVASAVMNRLRKAAEIQLER